jgi:branched-subunit amino acid transport protein
MNEAILASLNAVILSRAAERILLVLVGALAVYLGYSLFRHMPSVNRAEGKLELPGGVSIFLSRIGPGVFFALFGCAVIGYSVTKPVELAVPDALGVINYSGLQAGRPPSFHEIAIDGLDPEITVARLNGFLATARLNMSQAETEEMVEAVRAAKFAVMLAHWKSEWGDRTVFERWAKENGDRDPPDDLVPEATVVYRTAL